LAVQYISNHIKLTIIACYAPTNEANEDKKTNSMKRYKRLSKMCPDVMVSALWATSMLKLEQTVSIAQTPWAHMV
jgi:hypothetical protein